MSVKEAEAYVLRDEVIAGLRECGWPEPRIIEEDGVPVVIWGGPDDTVPEVYLCADGDEFGYQTADTQETGYFAMSTSAGASRIVEAIDRLRWVIGLPAQPLNTWAMQTQKFLNALPPPRTPGIAEDLAFFNRKIMEACAIPPELLVQGPWGSPPAPYRIHPNGRIEPMTKAEAEAAVVKMFVDGHGDAHEVPASTLPGADAAASDSNGEWLRQNQGRAADAAAGNRPLPPSKPDPKPERPYEPRKLGEF